MTIEEEFKKVTGETDDISVSLFLDKAEETVLEKTNRPSLVKELEHFKFDLATARSKDRKSVV